jgi:anti-sigma regulatory factor (Ser/Thr protein kinase)
MPGCGNGRGRPSPEGRSLNSTASRATSSLTAAEPPVGEPVGEWILRAEPQSARLARRLVAQALDGTRESLRRRAALVVSELVGNGVRHGRGGLAVLVDRLPDGWLLQVRDGSAAPPRVKHAARTDEGGRGMLIVTRMCDDTGWARTPTGKVVWARLADLPC